MSVVLDHTTVLADPMVEIGRKAVEKIVAVAVRESGAILALDAARRESHGQKLIGNGPIKMALLLRQGQAVKL